MSEEGSVMVDGVESTADLGETGSQDTHSESEVDDTSSSLPEQQGENTEGANTEGSQQRTDKGTRLDTNPMSALNQQLANERTKSTRYERVLTDPESLVAYARTMGLELTKKQAQQIQQEEEITPDRIETTEDLQKYVKQIDTKLAKRVDELNKEHEDVREGLRVEALANKIHSDISAVRESYPELNPNNKDAYDPELDALVGNLYEKADLDPKTQMFLGKVSIKEIADMVMKGTRRGMQKGSQEAQTIMKDRRSGRNISGGSNTAPDETKMSATQIIAQRMRQANLARNKRR